jgi:hemerythrin superfamily protein
MSLLEKVVAAVTPSASSDEINAIDLLKKDHDEVDALFKDYEMLAESDGENGGDRRALSTRICGLLAVHALIEEEIFYPAARQAKVDADLLDEAEIEHRSAKQLIAEIGAAKASEPLYDARVKVLGEYIRHHVKEEESELFPACRKSGMDLADIGARLERRKSQLLRKLEGK